MIRILFFPNPEMIVWLAAPAEPPASFMERVRSGAWQIPPEVAARLNAPRGLRLQVTFHGDLAVITPEQPLPAPSAGRSAKMTPEQVQILRLMALGLSSRKIARALSFSPRYVKYRVAEIKRLLGVQTREEAVRRALAALGKADQPPRRRHT